MRRLIPVILLIIALMITCGHLTAYLMAGAMKEWRFTVAPLAFSIMDSSVTPADHGWVVTVTFSPDPGPQSIMLSLSPISPAANEKEE